MGAKSMLKDNYFLGRSCTDIIADLASGIFTLAEISALQIGEQNRIGWIKAMELTGLYSQTSAGVWIAQRNASGQLTEANSSTLVNWMLPITRHLAPRVAGTSGLTAAGESYPRTKILTFATDGAGNAAAQAIHTGPAGYYPVVEFGKVISPGADASTEMLITVTGGALVGPAQVNIALVAYTPNTQMEGILCYNLTDASVVSLAIANGPVSQNVYVRVYYWSET
jgi:hypothetical protein